MQQRTLWNDTPKVSEEQQWLYLQCVEKAQMLIPSFAQSTGLDVEDLAQEVALYLWKKREYLFSASEPIVYAYATARNHLRNIYRMQKRRSGIVHFVPLSIPHLLTEEVMP